MSALQSPRTADRENLRCPPGVGSAVFVVSTGLPDEYAGLTMTEDVNEVKERIKAMMVENLMLQMSADEIADDQPLFGLGSLGLDSVDALQLVGALERC